MAWLAVRLAIAAVALLVASPPAPASGRQPSTPELIDQAAGAGRVDRDHATFLLAQALGDPARLPAAYRSSAPWDGTPVVARLRHAVPGIRDAALRRRARGTLAAQADGRCLTSDAALPATAVTAHFHLSYAPGTLGGGLSLGHWTDALESAWGREVTAFGWAAPPAFHFDPAPGGRVPVRLDPGLAPGLYGFVSTNGDHAGPVFDNPSTPWTEHDAQAVCMVLRSDYSGFGVPPAAALQATAAHEFNHAIQAGYLDIFGLDAPSDTLIEGTATWMEDEAADGANDLYHYLWPDVSQSMLRFQPRFPYPYWVVYRALTEPFGTTVPGGGEDIMQSAWEQLSRRAAGELDALDVALRGRGRTLDDAFHDAAVAMRFARPCTAAFRPPLCLEEADAYRAAAGRPEDHAALRGPGALAIDLEDGLSAAFVTLPSGQGPFSLRVANDSPSPGDVRGSVVCEPSGGLRVGRLAEPAGPGRSAALRSFDPAGCAETVAVLTTSRTGEGPRPVTLTLGPPIPEPPVPAAATVAGPPAAAALQAELRLAGSQRLRRARSRGVLAELGCSSACTLRWRLEVSRAERRRLDLPRRLLGRGRLELPAGPARPLRLALDRRVARRLASARTVRFRLFVLATDAQGRRTGAEARGRLRR